MSHECNRHRPEAEYKSKKSGRLAGATMRAISLIFCPGDDITAASLAIANQTATQKEVQAILPTRPEIATATVVSAGKKGNKVLI